MAILQMVLEDPTETLAYLESKKALHAFTHDAPRTVIEAVQIAVNEGRRFDAPAAIDAMREAGANEEILTQMRQHLLDSLPERDPLDQLVPRLLESHKKAQLAKLKEQIQREGDLGSLQRAHEVKKLLDPNG